MPTPFSLIGRLPFEKDNVAIATQDLEVGLEISLGTTIIKLSHSILEGHRFAIRRIEKGDDLMSWGMPFGRATRGINSGEYACNYGVLEALSGRRLQIELPQEPNFSDEITPFEFESARFKPASQVDRLPVQYHFKGFYRGDQRGVGTRNHIIILGVSSRVSGFVRHIEKQYKFIEDAYQNIDGIVGVVHTEGDDIGLNNRELVLRTLAGFVVHPNTGAVLLIDDGTEAITCSDVQEYMKDNQYPVDGVLVETLSLKGGFSKPADQCKNILNNWIPVVNCVPRTMQPLSRLKIALQCGGSDAFSGISGNPLAGWVTRELIRHGGSANLAETDELVGAEPYILKKVRSQDVAHRFLATIDRFVKRAERHGSSAAGNPSGGNKYRGLYNIYLKSLGAAMKKHPDVRLDEVIEYGERMDAPGFYFMDSPGNDLESIAGQVASGCNLIYFVTGNGSITNFPFVPTVKIVTTTRRYDLLSEDMDVNAGVYLEGTPMDELGANTLELTVNIASGKQSAGERAGHAQVQLWRNWRQPDDGTGQVDAQEAITESLPPGEPVPLKKAAGQKLNMTINGFASARGPAFERLGLILPTSLCAGQVARMSVDMLNSNEDVKQDFGVDRFVTLVHTEGCGASSGNSEEIFMRTMLGHLVHPSVENALLLEHGCEKTHNDYFRNYLEQHNLNPDALGWASIQLGGGIQKTMRYIESWFKGSASANVLDHEDFGASAIRLGVLIDPDIPEGWSNHLASLLADLVSSGGSVVLPLYKGLQSALLDELGVGARPVSLAYGQSFSTGGLHIMDTPSMNWQEMVTGLGATGVHIMLYVGNDLSRPGHPFIPLLQVSDDRIAGDLSVSESNQLPSLILKLISDTLSGTYKPIRSGLSNLDFQITRGLYGISL